MWKLGFRNTRWPLPVGPALLAVILASNTVAQPKVIQPEIVTSGCETFNIEKAGTFPCVAFGAPGLMSACGNVVHVWNEGTREAKNSTLAVRDESRCEPLLFSPTGEHLAARFGGSIELFDTQRGMRVNQFDARSVQFSRDGRLLLIQDDRGGITLRTLKPGKDVHLFLGRAKFASQPPPAMTSDGTVVIAAVENRRIVVCDLKSGRRYAAPDLLEPWPPELGAPPTLTAWRFTADNRSLLVCGMAKVTETRKKSGETTTRDVQVLTIWRSQDLVRKPITDIEEFLRTPNPPQEPKLRPRPPILCSIGMSIHAADIVVPATGSMAAVVDNDGVTLWDIKQLQLLGRIRPPEGGRGRFTNADFSNDGARLALGLHMTHISIEGDDPKANPVGGRGLAARATAHVQVWKIADLRRLLSKRKGDKP